MLFYRRDGIIFSKHTCKFLTNKHSDRQPFSLCSLLETGFRGKSSGYLSFIKSPPKIILIFDFLETIFAYIDTEFLAHNFLYYCCFKLQSSKSYSKHLTEKNVEINTKRNSLKFQVKATPYYLLAFLKFMINCAQEGNGLYNYFILLSYAEAICFTFWWALTRNIWRNQTEIDFRGQA